MTGRDAVLLAVSPDGLYDVLTAAGAGRGALAGTPLIDATNAVAHGVGELLVEDGRAIAEHVAEWEPGAEVVKAFHMFPSDQWTAAGTTVTVAMAGDHDRALGVVAHLIREVGGRPAVLGPLRRARQLDKVAGFVIGLAFSGVDPSSAVPAAPEPATAT